MNCDFKRYEVKNLLNFERIKILITISSYEQAFRMYFIKYVRQTAY